MFVFIFNKRDFIFLMFFKKKDMFLTQGPPPRPKLSVTLGSPALHAVNKLGLERDVC